MEDTIPAPDVGCFSLSVSLLADFAVSDFPICQFWVDVWKMQTFPWLRLAKVLVRRMSGVVELFVPKK